MIFAAISLLRRCHAMAQRRAAMRCCHYHLRRFRRDAAIDMHYDAADMLPADAAAAV